MLGLSEKHIAAPKTYLIQLFFFILFRRIERKFFKLKYLIRQKLLCFLL